MKITPGFMKLLLRLYPPYRAAGIKVEFIRPDWKELRVSMSLHWYNRNAFGTHFGGSLYSMIDPHLALLLSRLLGQDYLVWDKGAQIEFMKATKNKVSSVIRISDDALEDIKCHTTSGKKYFPKFPVEIHDTEGDLVARFEKVLYVRKKTIKNKKGSGAAGN